GGFDASDAALIDIGLFLLAGRDFDIEIVKGLAIDNGHTQLFTLSCVDQHTFHCNFSSACRASRAAVAPYFGGLPGIAPLRLSGNMTASFPVPG
ncbi:MAG TPA: hypothetical protein VFG62_02855, partial [Rhodopila sp.]|nr:hypothetical protein [Rhodopila sp.]